MEAAWIALIGTVLGGPLIAKVIDWLLSKGQKKTDAETAMRHELRKEADGLKQEALTLKEEIRQVEKELDQWKEKYFSLLQEYAELKGRLASSRPEGETW